MCVDTRYHETKKIRFFCFVLLFCYLFCFFLFPILCGVRRALIVVDLVL